MLSESERAAILKLRKRGDGIRQIARTLGAGRNTVRSIIRSSTAQVARANKAKPSRAQIVELYFRCGGNLVQVHKELTARGAQFSYPTLTRFVRENHFGNVKSNPTRSAVGAQQWLAEIIHGARSLEMLNREVIDSSDLRTLLGMAKNGRLRDRKKALTILARKRGIPNATISAILHSSRKTTRRYFTIYSKAGPSMLFGSSTRHAKTPPEDLEKIKHILDFLHQRPTSFGINRASWTQRALIHAYKERYDELISRRTVERLIKSAGYSWRKARRILTSPDPNYDEKVEVLSRTLMSLTESELFFFLDEWGPIQVRKRGGKAYSAKYDVPRISRPQSSKGTATLVAALSATTNQMTWTFVKTKDTRSMIDLLEILYNQHQAHSKLYVTWDTVSWHSSTLLTDWLDRFNEATRRQAAGPIIELVPLPTSAQFLNVVEGVLSAMNRAVINNSDYSSSDDMKLAISIHFTDRNKHFKDNPRRAGKAIWNADLFHGFDAFRARD
jgi:transposase